MTEKIPTRNRAGRSKAASEALAKVLAIRIASKGIAEEFRGLAVGESVRFPLIDSNYKYNSVRNAKYTTLVDDTLNGAVWSVKLDRCIKNCIVTRVS